MPLTAEAAEARRAVILNSCMLTVEDVNGRLFTGCSVDWQLYKKNGLDERRVWEVTSEQRSWIWIDCGRERLREEKVEDVVKKFAKRWEPARP